ncbi:murein DD-endopeptidase MepM/ murein hydrolase activator NlpD [Deinococcus metalli]|uniref:Murein DD-endopeptidase MepM/ murein hydrolase activator NlpD n=1 Tax=Deinococcus metalli TaxID=1141878 RepID=A0A7W8KDA1_9DEIO|nr:M23 family metallopeptidase [Deinococcus metalli]MBB5376067.1 murein DD-endopeptidase MepM/ murein hydrolase activator NlpD [Deinococcus metalli]
MRRHSWALLAAAVLWSGAGADSSYRVKPGDTLSGIAASTGVGMAAIRAANTRLKTGTAVQAGWVLTIPDRKLPATAHTVTEGQNLTVIARKYGITLTQLADANPQYRGGKAVWVGAVLTIPPRVAHAGAAPAQPAANRVTVRTASTASPLQGRGGWLWPLEGYHVVSSGFGERTLEGHEETHYGVDIVAPVGTVVRAARSGRVLESRPDFERGWGWTVVMEHPDGWITRYAHLSANLVKAGELVVRGQPIGRVGNTGRSTGPHLHFGTYLRWDPKDPLSLY